MRNLSRLQILYLTNAVIIAFYWPLSHWFYPDLYHQLLGFQAGGYDQDMVRIIGTIGTLPVIGFIYAAYRPQTARAFVVAYTVWCFLMSATYFVVIFAGNFPKGELFNAILLIVMGGLFIFGLATQPEFDPSLSE